MKKTITNILIMGFITLFALTPISNAATDNYGAAGAKENTEYTIEEMLVYGIQDEYLAKAEYAKIMETFGTQRPFSNIIKAEEQHITLLKPLFETYGYTIPKDIANELVVIPSSIEEALKIGVQAEIDNIKMYEEFLKEDLPDDIRVVFEELKNASENHLKAFENGVSRGTNSQSRRNR